MGCWFHGEDDSILKEEETFSQNYEHMADEEMLYPWHFDTITHYPKNKQSGKESTCQPACY